MPGFHSNTIPDFCQSAVRLRDNVIHGREILAELLSSFRANVETVLLGNGSPSTWRSPPSSREATFSSRTSRAPEDDAGARPLLGDLGTFRRIQFTSDLLPQDIIGMHILDADRKSFVFSPGRCSPTWSSPTRSTGATQGPERLLEAMSERQVTVDNRTYTLPEPFLVIATQNPYEQHGTYPLPESQLDRFNLRLRLSYPDRDSERQLIRENSLLTMRDGIRPRCGRSRCGRFGGRSTGDRP